MKKKLNESELDDDMRPEYDLSKLKRVGRGIYAERFRSGVNVTLLDEFERKACPDESYRPLVFSVIEDDGENVTIEIWEEDYQRDLAAGIDEDAILNPGRYKMKRGGFLARHPELKVKRKKHP